jgi:hypothetical protein
MARAQRLSSGRPDPDGKSEGVCRVRDRLVGRAIRKDTPCVATCGRPRKSDGRPCERPVRRAGMACKDHGGPGALPSSPRRTSQPRPPSFAPASGSPWQSNASSPPARPQPTPEPRPRQPLPVRRVGRSHLGKKERERVKEAEEFCAGVLTDGSWEQAVAGRLADRAGDTWQRLTRSRRKRNCKKLAQMARTILKLQDQVHQIAGELAGHVASVAGVRGAPLDFTRELVKRIPIGPVDAKLTAVARTIQIAGIVLCLMDGRDLTRCDCFIDLALAETKERVSQILEAGLARWTELARFGSTASTPAKGTG